MRLQEPSLRPRSAYEITNFGAPLSQSKNPMHPGTYEDDKGSLFIQPPDLIGSNNYIPVETVYTNGQVSHYRIHQEPRYQFIYNEKIGAMDQLTIPSSYSIIPSLKGSTPEIHARANQIRSTLSVDTNSIFSTLWKSVSSENQKIFLDAFATITQENRSQRDILDLLAIIDDKNQGQFLQAFIAANDKLSFSIIIRETANNSRFQESLLEAYRKSQYRDNFLDAVLSIGEVDVQPTSKRNQSATPTNTNFSVTNKLFDASNSLSSDNIDEFLEAFNQIKIGEINKPAPIGSDNEKAAKKSAEQSREYFIETVSKITDDRAAKQFLNAFASLDYDKNLQRRMMESFNSIDKGEGRPFVDLSNNSISDYQYYFSNAILNMGTSENVTSFLSLFEKLTENDQFPTNLAQALGYSPVGNDLVPTTAIKHYFETANNIQDEDLLGEFIMPRTKYLTLFQDYVSAFNRTNNEALQKWYIEVYRRVLGEEDVFNLPGPFLRALNKMTDDDDYELFLESFDQIESLEAEGQDRFLHVINTFTAVDERSDFMQRLVDIEDLQDKADFIHSVADYLI